MDAQCWHKAADIFLVALDLEGTERDSFVEKATAGDALVRREVEVLLASHERAGDFLELPPPSIPRLPAAIGAEDSRALDRARQIRRLGDYELLEEIAAGGMGVVFRARQISLNRIVALKTIVGGPLASSSMVGRFRTEAEAAANLDHPNIVPIFEVGEHEGVHYYSMRFIEGGSLQDHMGDYALPQGSEARALSRAEMDTRQSRVARLLAMIARGVHHAHQHGILHRDLKPANILLGAQGEPLIADFGIAKLLVGDGNSTRTATVIGTPNYMAPEQAAGGVRPLTTAADVFSLGAILYQLLTRRLPFQGATPLETLTRVIEQDPPPPRSSNKGIDRDLDTICRKALLKNPAQRYGSAEVLADDLERWLRGEPIAARPVSATERTWRWCRRKPALAAMSAGLILSIVTGLVISIWQWRRADRTSAILAQNLYVSDVGVGYGAWESGNIERARTLLDGQRPRHGDPDLRTFEWRYLFGLTRPREILTIRTGADQVWGSAVSPDGRLLATGSGNGRIQLWDLPSGAPLGTLQASSGIIYCIAFSPDGALLATATDTNEVHLWDTSRRQLVGRLVHRGATASLAFSPDGRTLATMAGYLYAIDTPAELSLWDVASRQKVSSLVGHTSSAGWMHFSPNGRLLATPQGDGSVTLWNVGSGTLAGRLTGHKGLVICARFSPDGTILATGGIDGSVRLWDVATRQMLVVLGFHQGAVYSLAFSPDGERLVSGGLDHTARLWNVKAQRPVGVLRGHDSRVFSVSYTPDGRTVLTASLDGTAKVWSSRDAPESEVFDRHPGNWATVDFSPNGRLMTRSVASADRITLWDAQRLGKVADIPHRDSSFSPDSSLLATTSAGGLTLWDVTGGGPKLVANIALDAPPIHTPVFSPDGQVLAASLGKPSPRIEIRSVAHRDRMAQLIEAPNRGDVASYAFSRDGTLFVTGYDDGRIRLWDARTWTAGRLLEGHTQRVNAVAFSPDGRLLATASADTTVQLWSTTFHTAPTALRGDGGAIISVAFSPDGQTLAVGSVDGTVKFWNVRTRREVATIKAHDSVVTSVAFSPDGRMLATISVDQTMRLWKAPALAETDR